MGADWRACCAAVGAKRVGGGNKRWEGEGEKKNIIRDGKCWREREEKKKE